VTEDVGGDQPVTVTDDQDSTAVSDTTHSTLDEAVESGSGSEPNSDEAAAQVDLRLTIGSKALKWLVGFVAIALLATAGAFAFVNHGDQVRDADAKAAMKTVESSLIRLFSYTPLTVEGDLASELGLLTGKFRSDYKTLVTGSLAPAAIKSKVSAVATVSAAGVVSSSKDKVVVLVFVNVSITTGASKQPNVGGSRVKVTAMKVGGKWKISALDPI
jgi:Mce-associated membrane protein